MSPHFGSSDKETLRWVLFAPAAILAAGATAVPILTLLGFVDLHTNRFGGSILWRIFCESLPYRLFGYVLMTVGLKVAPEERKAAIYTLWVIVGATSVGVLVTAILEKDYWHLLAALALCISIERNTPASWRTIKSRWL